MLVVAVGLQHYHDTLDGTLLPQLAHDAFQLSLPLCRQLLAAEVIPGLVQQLIWLCGHLLQRVLLQLILCEHCIVSNNRFQLMYSRKTWATAACPIYEPHKSDSNMLVALHGVCRYSMLCRNQCTALCGRHWFCHLSLQALTF